MTPDYLYRGVGIWDLEDFDSSEVKQGVAEAKEFKVVHMNMPESKVKEYTEEGGHLNLTALDKLDGEVEFIDTQRVVTGFSDNIGPSSKFATRRLGGYLFSLDTDYLPYNFERIQYDYDWVNQHAPWVAGHIDTLATHTLVVNGDVMAMLQENDEGKLLLQRFGRGRMGSHFDRSLQNEREYYSTAGQVNFVRAVDDVVLPLAKSGGQIPSGVHKRYRRGIVNQGVELPVEFEAGYGVSGDYEEEMDDLYRLFRAELMPSLRSSFKVVLYNSDNDLRSRKESTEILRVRDRSGWRDATARERRVLTP